MGHSFGCVLSALMLAMAPGQFQRAMLLDPVLFPPGMMKVVALSAPQKSSTLLYRPFPNWRTMP